MELHIEEQLQTSPDTTELYCERINFETYPISYSVAFAKRQFTEQIMVDPIENVHEKFKSTERSSQGLFRNGFLIYKY